MKENRNQAVAYKRTESPKYLSRDVKKLIGDFWMMFLKGCRWNNVVLYIMVINHISLSKLYMKTIMKIGMCKTSYLLGENEALTLKIPAGSHQRPQSLSAFFWILKLYLKLVRTGTASQPGWAHCDRWPRVDRYLEEQVFRATSGLPWPSLGGWLHCPPGVQFPARHPCMLPATLLPEVGERALRHCWVHLTAMIKLPCSF